MKKNIILFCIIILLFVIYISILNTYCENFVDKKYQKKYLIIRILGNDLKGLHGNNQTLDNLKFTLENEKLNDRFDSIYFLNRIHDENRKRDLKNILKKYNKKYLDIPFEKNKFNKLSKLTNIDINSIKNLKNTSHPKLVKIQRELRDHNLYLINNNGCRNTGINYGKNKNYVWTFVLDSNSFFTNDQLNEITSNIKKDTEYIILPQIRVKNNNDIYNKKILNNIEKQEPQIGFKNTSKLIFNEKIPYGSSPKAELLRVLNVPGKWTNWKDNEFVYGIKDRKVVENVKYQIFSGVIRLSSNNSDNNIINNYSNRTVGLYNLIKNIER